MKTIKADASKVAKAAKNEVAQATQTVKKSGGWLGKEAKDLVGDAVSIGGAAVGYAELLGLRYPVKAYRAQVSKGLTRGSRIDDPKGYAQLKAQGFKSVVDLRAEGKGDGKYGATQAGLNVKRIPIIDNTNPSAKQIKAFLDFVTNPANQPAYVHCEAGVGRTGIMCAAYRMAVEGWSPDKALAEAKKMGCAIPEQQEFILQLGADLKAGKIQGYK